MENKAFANYQENEAAEPEIGSAFIVGILEAILTFVAMKALNDLKEDFFDASDSILPADVTEDDNEVFFDAVGYPVEEDGDGENDANQDDPFQFEDLNEQAWL